MLWRCSLLLLLCTACLVQSYTSGGNCHLGIILLSIHCVDFVSSLTYKMLSNDGDGDGLPTLLDLIEAVLGYERRSKSDVDWIQTPTNARRKERNEMFG